MPGIGKTLEEKLQALDETGDIPSAVKLRAKFPAGLIAIMHLPGFGAKRAKLLYDELGIDSLEKLREAAEAEQIRGIRGLGERVEENLLRVLAEHEEGGAPRRESCCRARSRWRSRSRARCATIPPRTASRSPAPCAGSGDTAKDIDIIATADDVGALISTLADLELVETVAAQATRARG